MLYNISSILKEPFGFTEKLPVENYNIVYDDLGEVAVFQSEIQFIKTDSGVWVNGIIPILFYLDCSRCLKKIESTMNIKLNEEFKFDYNVQNPEEDHSFLIDDDNHLRLDACLREYIVVNMPLKPICDENCKFIIW
jgi:uncharacterized protein